MILPNGGQTLDMIYKFQSTQQKVMATIPAGQQLSNLIDMGGMQPVKIYFLGTWTNSDVRFFSSFDGTEDGLTNSWDGYIPANPDAIPPFAGGGSLTLYNVSANTNCYLLPYQFCGDQYLSIESSNVQITDAHMIIILQPLVRYS